jgi:tetratricopeptide (TPR) repeat protein
MTQNNLGNAYRDLAAIEDRADNLRRAIAAFTEALRYYTPQNAPLDYAMTQNNLGNAYGILAAIEDRADNLRRAIAACTEALRYYTPESAPLDYAMTQANMGMVYVELGDLPGAITCWRKAERYFRQMGAVVNADLMLRWIADAGAGK